MKILFTADWHIKLGQKNVPVEWAKNRYYGLFSKVRNIAKERTVEYIVIGGDIFDKLPSIEELELYFDLVRDLDVPTLIYSGNHEAVKKNTTFLTQLIKVTSAINKNVEIVDDFYSNGKFDIIPYNKLKEWAENPDNTFVSLHGRILMTHVRGEIPPHVKPEVDLDLFKPWRMVLAGDLHSYENSQRNILYPGSPVTTSFHRSEVDTGVLVVDTDSLDYEWVKLNLPQLLKKTVKAGEPMPPTEFHHTIYEVEGNMADLANLSSELLDKKIVKKASDTTLILENNMTLEDEVHEYLKYILNLDDKTIAEVMTEFQNYAGKIHN